MNMLNSLIIEGNVTSRGELKELQYGLKAFSVSIKSERTYKDSTGHTQDDSSSFDVSFYGNMAEITEREAEIGRGLRVVGRLKQIKWTDQDGKKHSKIDIIAEHVEFKPKKHLTNKA